MNPSSLNKSINQSLHQLYANSPINSEGSFGQNNTLVYYKPKGVDEFVRDLFAKFLSLTTAKQKEKSKTYWMLPPFFEGSDVYDEPIGAHITVVNRKELNQHSINLNDLVDFYNIASDEDKIIAIERIEKVEPKYWKNARRIELLQLRCPAITNARMKVGLHQKIGGEFQLHMVFAMKASKTNVTRPTLSPTIPINSPIATFSEVYAIKQTGWHPPSIHIEDSSVRQASFDRVKFEKICSNIIHHNITLRRRNVSRIEINHLNNLLMILPYTSIDMFQMISLAYQTRFIRDVGADCYAWEIEPRIIDPSTIPRSFVQRTPNFIEHFLIPLSLLCKQLLSLSNIF